jgi:hypothetical protein
VGQQYFRLEHDDADHDYDAGDPPEWDGAESGIGDADGLAERTDARNLLGGTVQDYQPGCLGAKPAGTTRRVFRSVAESQLGRSPRPRRDAGIWCACGIGEPQRPSRRELI